MQKHTAPAKRREATSETNFARASREARRQQIDELLVTIKTNRPWWADRPPWEAERILEFGGDKRQRELFDVESSR
jgi:hypothetical protein